MSVITKLPSGPVKNITEITEIQDTFCRSRQHSRIGAPYSSEICHIINILTGWVTRPSLIRIKMEFQQQWYFFWFLYMFEDDCKKRKFSKKGESASTGPPKILLAPLRVQISKLSELYDVGTLNLCLETPGTMQKESAQSDHPVQRKLPKCSEILGYFETTKSDHILDVFSGQGGQIELIPFALCQAS